MNFSYSYLKNLLGYLAIGIDFLSMHHGFITSYGSFGRYWFTKYSVIKVGGEDLIICVNVETTVLYK